MVKALRFYSLYASGILVKLTQSLGFTGLAWKSPREASPLRLSCVSHVHAVGSTISQYLHFLWYLFVYTSGSTNIYGNESILQFL